MLQLNFFLIKQIFHHQVHNITGKENNYLLPLFLIQAKLEQIWFKTVINFITLYLQIYMDLGLS